jgi:hypothetical protein
MWVTTASAGATIWHMADRSAWWVDAASTGTPASAAVAAELGHTERAWFADPRSPSRCLGVSTHPRERVVVLSLWAGERCTSTFQLPIEEAPHLVGVLTQGLVDALPVRGDAEPEPRPSPPWWRAAIAWWRARRLVSPPGLRLIR